MKAQYNNISQLLVCFNAADLIIASATNYCTSTSEMLTYFLSMHQGAPRLVLHPWIPVTSTISKFYVLCKMYPQ